MELFEQEFVKKELKKPLADRMRPKTLEEFVGQEHLMGEGKLLKTLLDRQDIPSLIFWGPSGTGKTSLGFLIGKALRLPFVALSAVNIGIKEVKDVIQKSKHRKLILFIDEFHRFNKLQQDTFLPYVENGEIILIGATTENPSFEIIAPLISRMRVVTLNPLTDKDIERIVKRALKEDSELAGPPPVIGDDVIEELSSLAMGDARKALNLLEVCYKMAAQTNPKAPVIDHATVREGYQKRILVYDKKGEYHYDLISALHKSLRGSDPDASLYWLARMIESGEDPLFIARRMVRFASEDVGNADPFALSLAMSCMEAFNFIGPPEGYLALAQAAVYLALAEKSNAIYKAYGEAERDVRDFPECPVPLHLRNAPTKLMKELGYAHGYLYPHDFDGGIVRQEYMPEKLRGRRYYHPTDRGYERKLQEFLERVKNVRRADAAGNP
jgi:putative ATPase